MSQQIQLAQDKEAEVILLGSILLDGAIPNQVLAQIGVHDFQSKTHRYIYESILDLHNAGTKIDFLNVTSHIEGRNLIDVVGGKAYIAELASPAIGKVQLESIILKLRECTTRRKLAFFANRLNQQAGNHSEDIISLAKEMRELADKIRVRHSINAQSTLNEIVCDRLIYLEKICENPSLAQGVPTGYRLLDYLTAGLHKGELTLLAARPRQGKTSLAMNIAQAAAKAGKKVLFVSLEMTKEAIIDRLLCSIAQVDLLAYRAGRLKREDFSRLAVAQMELDEYGENIIIHDDAKMSVGRLEGIIRGMSKERAIDLVIVDYLQLLRPDKARDQRHLEVGQISRGLKALALELGLPVLGLSQLNREIEHRSSKRPVLSDLRESGDLEQDADMVWFLYYPNNDEDQAIDEKNVELIIGKQRNGPTGAIPLIFNGRYTQFLDASYVEKASSA